MTDPCLKQVNRHYVTQLEPNKIQVSYTNGISRTFEDTLITMLIVLRDVSPSLSIWEAFELRTLASLITYYITIMKRKCASLENKTWIERGTPPFVYSNFPIDRQCHDPSVVTLKLPDQYLFNNLLLLDTLRKQSDMAFSNLKEPTPRLNVNKFQNACLQTRQF